MTNKKSSADADLIRELTLLRQDDGETIAALSRKLAEAAHRAEMAEIKAKAAEAKAEAYFNRVGERQVVIDELKSLIVDMVRD